jgi:hypothetical protein
MLGQIGLNTIPTARMLPTGTVNMSLSRQSPYTHAMMGLQISDRLYLGLRQTSYSESLTSDSDHLYPGLDAKFKLVDERRYTPELSIGLQSALGHRRMAAEYLALSKRYHDFDFTFGLGWGRMGTRKNFGNFIPVDQMGGGSDRILDGEDPNTPADWFRGDMGIFGGVEYNTPIPGLSLKADWSSDAWTAEKAADPNFQAPAPWSLGLSYKPITSIDTGIAYSGNNTIMARISFTPNSENWLLGEADKTLPITMVSRHSYRNDPELHDDTFDDDDRDPLPYEYNITTEKSLGLNHVFIDTQNITGDLILKGTHSAPEQIGNAARYLSNNAAQNSDNADPERITLHLRSYGLRGSDITLNRSDVERAFLTHRGSNEEIWQTTTFHPAQDTSSHGSSLSHFLSEAFLADEVRAFKLDLINDVSLSEDDSGVIYRTGIVASLRKFFGQHFMHLTSGRINLADNLSTLNQYRTLSPLPVRSDIDIFTQNRLLLERDFLTGFATLGDDLHVATGVGYIEEMYMGLTSEILYRPFGKNWALGVDAALALKRDPYSTLALAPNGDHILTGFLNAYYEIPNSGITVKASAGRFLAGDVGATLALTNTFKNGVTLKGDVTATNQSDTDIYGGNTNIYTGIHLSLPLGSLPYVPDGSRIVTHAAPLGRDMAQRLDTPMNLYDMTEPLSYRHITRHWSQLQPAP